MQDLLSIAAFYKNNLPGGVGVQITFDLVTDLDGLLKLTCEANRQVWRLASAYDQQRQVIADLLLQLKSFGMRQQGSMTFEDGIVALGTIWLLEQVGEIKADEFNGMSYVHAIGWSPPTLLR